MVDKDGQVATRSDEDVEEAFRSVLEGLRTTLPGVEAIFAFLLIVPFQAAFKDADAISKGAYYLAFSSAALGVVLLIAPSAHQRLRATQTGVRRRSPHHLAYTVKLTIAGTIMSAIAMASAVFLVSTLTFSNVIAVLATTAVGIAIAWAWFFVPLVTFSRDQQ